MQTTQQKCHCGSAIDFAACCLPFIKKVAKPPSPEALMRSRYSAYVSKHYQYLLNTYAQSKQQNLSIDQLQQGADETQWLKLDVLSAFEDSDVGEVEFIAYYSVQDSNDPKGRAGTSDFYAMHERSRFVKEADGWRYLDGEMLNKNGKLNLGRNQTCLCGSGLKFKRCCGR
jgi:SEC-C motif-containing protein